MYITSNISIQQDCPSDTRAVMWTRRRREGRFDALRKPSLYTFEVARLSTFIFLTEQRKINI